MQGEVFSIEGKVRAIGRDHITGEIVSDTGWSKNLIMFGTNTGKDLILDRLGGDNTYTLNITSLGIGTGNTTPAIGDTTLTTPVAVATSPVVFRVSNVLSFQFFFADANLGNGTYKEVGTFVDGTQMFNHALFGTPYVKTAGVDTTIQVDFTLV